MLSDVDTSAQDVANAEASAVSKDDLEPAKGLLHAVAGKGTCRILSLRILIDGRLPRLR